MAWGDARHLPQASNTSPIDGRPHLLQVVTAMLEAEQDPVPDDLLAEQDRPMRAKVDPLGGAWLSPPSYRLRTYEAPFSYAALLTADRHAMGPLTEVGVVKRLAIVTDSQLADLKGDKDDASADWRFVAFEIVQGAKKQRRVKVLDVEQDAKTGVWEGRQHRPDAQARPPKHIVQLRPDPGFVLRTVWYDAARQEEPARGAFKAYLTSGVYPRVFQEMRTDALRIIRARAAVSGYGVLADLPKVKVAAVRAMLADGGLTVAEVAAAVGLTPQTVERIGLAELQPAPVDRTEPKAPKAPRAPRKAAPPEPPVAVSKATVAE